MFMEEFREGSAPSKGVRVPLEGVEVPSGLISGSFQSVIVI